VEWKGESKSVQTYTLIKSNGDNRKWTSHIIVFNKTNNKRKLMAKEVFFKKIHLGKCSKCNSKGEMLTKKRWLTSIVANFLFSCQS